VRKQCGERAGGRVATEKHVAAHARLALPHRRYLFHFMNILQNTTTQALNELHDGTNLLISNKY
jgi:hypothetical protein